MLSEKWLEEVDGADFYYSQWIDGNWYILHSAHRYGYWTPLWEWIVAADPDHTWPAPIAFCESTYDSDEEIFPSDLSDFGTYSADTWNNMEDCLTDLQNRYGDIF